MAKVTFSPLIVAASGSVKDTVFSKWKGKNYIRARVIPANPNTAAQQAVRESLARCVTLWQSFEAQIEAAWNLYAGPYGYSGYNAFVKANRATEQAGTELQATPPNADVTAVSDLAASTGAASGEIDLAWTDPGQGAGYYAYIMSRKTGTDVFVVEDHDTTLMSAAAYTITGLTPATSYQCYLSSEKIADDLFSESDADTATSQT